MTAAFITLFALVSTGVHLLILVPFRRRAPVVALVFAGALVAVPAYQLWVYIDLGFLDPFFMVAAAVQFGIALVIGAIVAAILRRYSSAPVSSP